MGLRYLAAKLTVQDTISDLNLLVAVILLQQFFGRYAILALIL